MVTTTFDTLKFANTLKAAGVPDKQAEAQASVLGEALAINFKELATKDDLTMAIKETEQRLNAKIEALAAKFDIETFAAKFDGQFTQLKWMIGLSISLSTAPQNKGSDLENTATPAAERLRGYARAKPRSLSAAGVAVSSLLTNSHPLFCGAVQSVAVLIRLFIVRIP